jgi:N-acyl-D-aspartate/D-glutamate deacylase
MEMDPLSPAGRIERLRHDAGLRRQLVEDRPQDEHTRRILDAFHRIYVVDDDYDYEPHPSLSIGARARAGATSPWSIALDAMMACDGKQLLVETFENYTEGNLDNIREMIEDEATVMGIADGGAHVCTVCDAS